MANARDGNRQAGRAPRASRESLVSVLPWVLVLTSGLVAAAAAPGEEPAERFSETTTALVVEVPVEVTFEGSPVRGLDASRFTLWDEREKQRILAVEEIDLDRLEVPGRLDAAPLELPVAARRHFLLLFDRTYARPTALERARRAAAGLVAEDLHPADLVAVATYSRAAGAELVLGFTSDRGQVTRALEDLVTSQSSLVSGDPLRLSLQNVSLDTEGGGGNAGARGVAAAAAQEAAQDLQALRDRTDRAQAVADVGVMARSLSQLAAVLRHLDGRKHVVFFSEGFDDQLLTGSGDESRLAEIGRQRQDNAIWRVDSSEYFGSSAAFDIVDTMTEHFRRAGAAVHAVDIGGLRAGGDAASTGVAVGGTPVRGSAHRRSGRGGLFMIADGTGGELYENSNDLGGAMGELLEKTRVTYLLTFQPSELEPDGSFHKLKVEVEGLPRRARVTHRPGYFAPDAGASSGLVTQLDLAARLFDDRPGPLGFELLAPVGRVRQGTTVPFLVDVDGASAFAGSSEPGRVELYVYAFSLRGELAARAAQAATVDLSALPEAADGKPRFTLRTELELPEGDYDIRALLRHAGSGRTGLRTLPLRVGPRGLEQLAASRRTDVRPPAEAVDPSPSGEGPASGDGSVGDGMAEDAEDAEDLEAGAFVAAYRSAVEALLEGRRFPGEVAAEVAVLESAALGDGGERGVRRLARRQGGVLEEMAEERPRALLAAVVLHHELFLEHRRTAPRPRRAWLVHHSLESARELASSFAGRGEDAGSLALAADALASLGGYLQAQGRVAGRAFFEQAIALDPACEAARVALAVDYEKRGGPWDEVTRGLAELLELRPGSREARLRLGVNLLRLSAERGAMDAARKRQEAEAHLRLLLADGAADWIASLAAQELADSLSSRGRAADAKALLRDMLERRPADQKIGLQLAFLLDRARRPEASRRVLEDLRAAADAAPYEEPPRGLYNRWPRPLLDAARGRVYAAASSLESPDLAVALEAASRRSSVAAIEAER